MIRSLLKLGLFLVVGILIYNFFFGTSEEKAQSKAVFRETGQAVSAAWGLLTSEKKKFDSGKYDDVLDKLGGAYSAIRERAEFVDKNVIQRLGELEKRKKQLEREMEAIEQGDTPPVSPPAPPKKGVKPAPVEDTHAKAADQERRKEKMQRDLDALVKETNALLKQAQEK